MRQKTQTVKQLRVQTLDCWCIYIEIVNVLMPCLVFFCFVFIIIADGIVVVKMKESEDSKSAGEVGIDTYYYFPLL